MQTSQTVTFDPTNPYPWYRYMRDNHPIHYDEQMKMWYLFRYEDVQLASHDTDHFSSEGSKGNGFLLILICILNIDSEMRKKHHRTKPLRLSGQFIETLTEPFKERFKRGKDLVVEIFLSQFFPKVLHRIDLWAIGRLSKEADIFGENQVLGMVP